MIQIAIDPDMDFDSDCILFLEVTGAKEIDEKLLTKCYTKACERGKFLRKLIEKFATDDTGQPIEFLHEWMSPKSLKKTFPQKFNETNLFEDMGNCGDGLFAPPPTIFPNGRLICF